MTELCKHKTMQLLACCNTDHIPADLEVNSAGLELSALLSLDLLCSVSVLVITGSLVLA